MVIEDITRRAIVGHIMATEGLYPGEKAKAKKQKVGKSTSKSKDRSKEKAATAAAAKKKKKIQEAKKEVTDANHLKASTKLIQAPKA